jgi:T-complex protein 1 subunit eta
MQQPQIIILKEGTDTSQGKGQLLSNITAACAVADAIRTTLGPRGMDKLIVSENNKVTISNDGATVLRLLDIVHPAGKTLVDISRAQDAEVGDGTTSVTLFAAELLAQIKPFVEDGVAPRIIINGFRKASLLAINKINEIAVHVDRKNTAYFIITKVNSVACSKSVQQLQCLQRSFMVKNLFFQKCALMPCCILTKSFLTRI